MYSVYVLHIVYFRRWGNIEVGVISMVFLVYSIHMRMLYLCLVIFF